jgi:dynein heavy chain, axonemal
VHISNYQLLPLCVCCGSWYLLLALHAAQVLTALDDDERRLFADRVLALDRRIGPGLSKLTWLGDKHTLELYVHEAQKHCRAADATVATFKAGVMRIETECAAVADGLLVNIERKKLYDVTEFEAVQAAHHAMVRSKILIELLSILHAFHPSKAMILAPKNLQAKQRLIAAHERVRATLMELHTPFSADSEDVQREWVRFTVRVDKRMEEALHQTVRRSLQALSRLLNGDSKTEVLPIFRYHSLPSAAIDYTLAST